MGELAKLAVDEFVAKHVAAVLKLEGFFPEFSADLLCKVFPRSGLYAFPEGTPIITQGEGGTDVFIVYTGAVKIIKEFGGAVAEIARMGPGDLIGEIALLEGGERTATAVAAGESQIFRVVAADLTYIIANNHELATHLQRLVAERLGR